MAQAAYTTVAAPAAAEFVEKRSRFIGQIAPVSTPEEAAEFMGGVRAQHREASHHCYAYVLRQGGLQRFSDDGEPSGTAGRPILEVVRREGLVDAAVVVTRYFGGVLLGAGGLTRAYAQGAKCAVDAARVLRMRPAVVVGVDADYAQYGKITHLLPGFGAAVLDTRFTQGVRLTLLLPRERLDAFARALGELSAGAVAPLILEEKMAPFDGDSPDGTRRT